METTQNTSKNTIEGKLKPVIITIISDQNLVEFQRQIDFLRSAKTIVTLIKNVTMVIVGHGDQAALMAVPHAYIEYEATEDEYRLWKFGQVIQAP